MFGSQLDVGTLNVTMNDMAGATGYISLEHYGVLTGSSVSANEDSKTTGKYSRANFDNLNIAMNANENKSLLVGIRAIQGAGEVANRGEGSSGYVSIGEKLNINLEHNGSSTAEAAGVYISGGDSQVHLKDSEINIKAPQLRANAIVIGKSGTIGGGPGALYSTGHMQLDTTASEKSTGAIDIASQGSLIDANADTSRTTIKTATDGISNSTKTLFNNLVIETSKDSGNLINVGANQSDYELSVRGEESNLTAAKEGYILNVAGTATRPSNVTINFDDGYMQGLVNKSEAATLQMNLKDATWQLAESGENTTASFNQLNLRNSHLIAVDQDMAKKSDFTLAGSVIAKKSTFDMQNGFAGDRLIIDGNYSAGGNHWLMEAHLTGQGESVSTNDQVKITGDVIDKGYDWVSVGNLNLQNPTGLETLLVFDIGGKSDGHFLLKERVVKGPYEYLLNQNPVNGNWYLESVGPEKPVDPVEPEELIPVMPMLPSVPPKPVDPVEPVEPEELIPVMPMLPSVPPKPVDPVIRPEVGSYAFNSKMANNLFTHRLEDRLGASTYTNMNDNNVGQLWIRSQGGRIEFKDKSSQVRTDGDSYMLHAGMGLANFGQNDEFNVGIMGAYADAESDSYSTVKGYKSSSKVDGYGVGLYGTWYQKPEDKTGTYADVWFLWNNFNNQVSGQDLATDKYDSDGLIASAEVGKTFKLAQNNELTYWVQPQAQIVYQGVKLDGFTEKTSRTQVTQGDSNIQTRLGAKAYMVVPTSAVTNLNYRPYISINWINNSDSNAVQLDGTSFGIDGDRNIGELKLGLEGQTSKNGHAWMNIGYQQGDESYKDVIGSLGWKLLF